jgi:predicted HicB family RNase H-like nuclease
MKEIVRSQFRIPEEVHRKLRFVAADKDLSVNAVVIMLLLEALEAHRASFPNP